MSKRSIQVWDIPIRVFHWSLVLCFSIAFLSGDEESVLHIYAGYAVIALVLFRMLWGFIGSEHARFRDFVFGPGKVVAYLKSLMSGHPARFLGHNPAGGYMVVLMLATLLVVTFSGLKAYGAEGHGPLAAQNAVQLISAAQADEGGDEGKETEGNAEEEYWEEIHEASAYFMLGLIVLHILSVAVSGRLHKENLVKAMITGNKEEA